MSIVKHEPIITAACSAISSYALAIIIYVRLYGNDELWPADFKILCLAAGFIYTNIFEYFFHRLFQHFGLPGLEFIKQNHLEHHHVFYDESFQSDDEQDLKFITLPWHIFPILFAIHWLMLVEIVPRLWGEWTWLRQYAPIFFGGVVIRFLIYEIPHYLTHARDNMIDWILLKVPLIGYLRRKQIEFHKRHHEYVRGNFSFAPIYLDSLFGTRLKTKKSA